MTRFTRIEQVLTTEQTPQPSRKRAARSERKQSAPRSTLHLELLEARITPSLLGTFELDGNAQTGVLGTSGSTTTSHDWDQVYADAGSPTALGSTSFANGPLSGALAGGFIKDVVNSNTDDIFTGGGSKDTQGIQNWLFTGSRPQGKDDISNAFAAAYTDPGSGDLVLYAGLDRYDNSGDSTAGFWFLGNQIGENPNVTTQGGHPFTGQHANGDILLISNFTQGGSVSTIAVYEWVGNDSTGSLKFIGGNSSNTFAIVNGAPISVPWSFTDKAGQTQPQAGEFLEEGVDLTALGLSGCFDTFLAETRSSQSPTSTLSDFALGSFPVCTIAATPFNGLSKFDTFTNHGDSVTYPLTVTNTGAVKLYLQNVSDTLLGNIVVNGVVQQPGAAGVNPFVTSITTSGVSADGSLAPGASAIFYVTRTVQANDPDPTNSTTTFVYNDDPGPTFGPDQDTASAAESVNLFQPSASLTETASPTTTSNPGQVITYTFTVTNTSSSDSPNLVLDTSNPNDSFSDTLLGNLEADAIHAATGDNTATVASIAPGASFSFTETRAIQPTDPTPLTDTASVAFTLAQNLGSFPNVIHAGASSTVTLVPTLAAPGFTGLSKFDVELNKGDAIKYALMVKNTGPINLYVQNVTESLLGNIVLGGVVQAPVGPVTSIDASALGSGLLAPGQSVTIYVTRTVQAGDPDPTNSTVTFTYNTKADFSGVQATASAADSVNLFQPSATLTEVASPTTATTAGQVITYTFTVTNTSSSDSPNLVLDTSNPNDSFSDTLLGNLEADAIHAATGDNTATVASIAPGASFSFTETRAIQAGDPSPLTDTATATFTLAQNLGSFPNVIHASASASVTLPPNLSIVKTVTDNKTVIHPGDTASFTITVSNTGAGTANNVVMTDNLPDASMLTWTVSSFTGFTAASVSSSGVLTATAATLAGGGTASVVVSAVVPLNFFGTSGNGMGQTPPDPVPLDLFELDGNATTGVLVTPNTPPGSTTISHDWDQVWADNTANPTTNTAGALASSFVTDKINTTKDDIFTGGGSKDPNAISQWQFKNGKPQGKDDIENAFAALYKDPSTGDRILYAGLDRFDNSGNSTAGFWFFVNPISENANGTFSGTHSDGDILLISNFTIGGSVSTIVTFQWSTVPVNGSNLVPINGGNPIGGSTFAIVNGSPISVPWSYMNKSGANQPAAGEFLEEGINLTALGLNGCFSSFLAETRSSQSQTATLSDIVLGSFSTCDVMLPNVASVSASNFNNGQPITSNEVIIDLNDGDPQLAASVGNGPAPASLTQAQLQPIVAQAIASWLAAGADPSALSNVANYAIHIAKLPDGELGWEVPGQIWIDPTAQGWGWSLGSTPTPGRMDLLTVVSHEVGHVLGYGDHASGNDLMTTSLDTGVRRLPEAPSSTGNVMGFVASPAGATASGAISFRAGESGVGQPGMPLAALSGVEASDAVFATGAGDGGVVPAAVGLLLDEAGGQRSLPGVLTSLVQLTPPVLSATPAVSAAVLATPDRDASSALVPGLLPPIPRLERGGDRALPQEAGADGDQPGGLAPRANPGDTPFAQDAAARADVLFQQLASDACFANGFWRPGPAGLETPLPVAEPSGATPGSVSAAVVLAIALGGVWGAHRAEPEPRTRRRFLI